MRLEHEQTLLNGDASSFPRGRLECICWTSSASKLAVCCASSMQLMLFDGQTLEKREKFALKSAAGGKLDANDDDGALVKAIAFSPEEDRLAVGQTDNVIFVYRIGQNWGEKKSIVGKYALQSSVVELCWKRFGLIFATLDGKVKLIDLKSGNRIVQLLSSAHAPLTLACNENNLLVSFLDGSVQLVQLAVNGSRTSYLCNAGPIVYYALCLTVGGGASNANEAACIGGVDGRLHFMSTSSSSEISRQQAQERQTYDLHSEILFIVASPSGDCVIVNSGMQLLVFIVRELEQWIQVQKLQLCQDAGTIASLAFSPDGSRLVAGCSNGSLELFSIRWRQKQLASGHIVTFVGHTQLNVHRNGQRPEQPPLVLRSAYPIQKVRLIADQFLVGWTTASLLFGRLPDDQDDLTAEELERTKQTSELLWNRNQANLRFCFDFENAILIQSGGELHVFQWNTNELIASVRTQFVSPHVLSVRLDERDSNRKALAYLIDAKSICILDLNSGQQLDLIWHDQPIDWLELNGHADKILFRDRQLKLHLQKLSNSDFSVGVDVGEDEAAGGNKNNFLLAKCSFVQWVPLSDVIVAQTEDQLHIFYDVQRAEIKTLPNGILARDICRQDGRSWIQFTGNHPDLLLDEMLLEYDTAVQNGDLIRAMQFLERAQDSGNRLTLLWRQLAEEAVRSNQNLVAERAFAAAGDLIKSQFARHCAASAKDAHLLKGDFQEFERQNDFEYVLETYKKLRLWPEAISFANRCNRPDQAEQLRTEFTRQLLENGQQFEAAQMAEEAGKIVDAISMYLTSNQLLSAARCILRQSSINDRGSMHNENACEQLDEALVHKVLKRLEDAKFYEEAGELYEQLSQLIPTSRNLTENLRAAMSSYERGEHFDHCLRIARLHFPAEVVRLERMLGEQLMRRGQPAAAIAHFIEAGATQPALQAALAANQLERAAELAHALGESLGAEQGRRLASKLAQAQLLDSAVNVLYSVGLAREAVILLNDRGQHARAYDLATSGNWMKADEIEELYSSIGKKLEQDKKYVEAENVYVAAGLIDQAILMYKTAKNYDVMLRLVHKFRPELLSDTRLHLAKELEAEGAHVEAEKHYVSAGEWQQAMQMYKQANKFEQAYNLAKTHGGLTNAKQQIAFLWARSLKNASPADVYDVLKQIGQVQSVLELAVENGAFEFASQVAKQWTKESPEVRHKQGQINLRWAAQLEQKGQFEQAEALYLEAGKLKDAISMWLQANQHERALQLAERSSGSGGRVDASLLRQVCLAYVQSLLEQNSASALLRRYSGQDNGHPPELDALLTQIERLSLRAGRPEVALNLLLQNDWPTRATRFANAHAPHLLDAVRRAGFGQIDQPQLTTSVITDVSRPQTATLSAALDAGPLSAAMLQQLHEQLDQAARHGNREQLLAAAYRLAAGQMRSAQTLDALRILQQHAAMLLTNEACHLLSSIAKEIFMMTSGIEPPTTVWQLLRDVLFTAQGGPSTDSILPASNKAPGAELIEQLQRQMLVSHFLLLRATLGNLQKIPGADELHDKLCISLLRYTDLVRVDRAFYHAGQACLDSGRVTIGYVFLNHFLDLVNAIEEGQLELDYTDLDGTDIPNEVPLPASVFCISDSSHAYRFTVQSLSENASRKIELSAGAAKDNEAFVGTELIDQVKNWVLQKAMDAGDQQFMLPADSLRKGGVFESSLEDSDGTKYAACLVTGYPVLPGKQFDLGSERWTANKDDWNKLLMITKMSSNEQLKESLHFIGRLCGTTSTARFSFQ